MIPIDAIATIAPCDCSVLFRVASEVLRVRGGMPKKGIKKNTKDEKVFMLRSKVQYMTQNLAQQSTAIVNEIANDPDFFSKAVRFLSIDRLRALNDDINSVSRNDQLIKVLPDYLVQQVAAMKQQQQDIAEALKAIDVAVEYAFTNKYYASSGFDSTPFYEMVGKRIQDLEDEQARQVQLTAEAARLRAQFDDEVRAHAQALLQQQQSASAPSNTDAMQD